MSRLICVLAVVVCWASSAFADVPPPPPEKGFKRVPYENVVRCVPEVTGYRFFTFERLGIGGKEKIGEELKLKNEPSAPVPTSSSASVRTGVVAVPMKLMEQLGKTEELEKLLYRENKEKMPKGVVVFETYQTTWDLKTSDPRSKVVNVITVSPDKEAGVKFSEAGIPAPPKGATKAGAFPRSPAAKVIAGLAMAMAMTVFGLRVFRRK